MSIVIENLSYDHHIGSTQNVQALKSVDLMIVKGSICAVMGRTGCGKSTLFNLIAGLYEPAVGRIMIDGEDINSNRYDRLSLRKKLGIVFQHNRSQLFETTAYRNAAYGLKHADLSEDEKKERIRWAFDVTGFDYDTVKDRSPLELSGGERKKLAIAAALVKRPDYLILDDPVAGLGPGERKGLLVILKKLNQDGMTILVSTHHSEFAATCADDVAIMKEGRIAAFGEVHKIFGMRQLLEECGIRNGFPSWISAMLTERGLLKENDAITTEELLPLIKDALMKRSGRREE